MLKLTEAAPSQRRRNLYRPLVAVLTHPFRTAYVAAALVTALCFAIGVPTSNDNLVGLGLVLGYMLVCFTVFAGLFAGAVWTLGGGYDRMVRNLRDKADRHSRIED